MVLFIFIYYSSFGAYEAVISCPLISLFLNVCVGSDRFVLFFLCLLLLETFIFFTFSSTERVHLHPCGPGRRSDWKCMLGAVLPGAWCRSWWRFPERSCSSELPWRSVQHFLQHWEFWSSRSQSALRRPGAHSDRWADPYSPKSIKLILIFTSCQRSDLQVSVMKTIHRGQEIFFLPLFSLLTWSFSSLLQHIFRDYYVYLMFLVK